LILIQAFGGSSPSSPAKQTNIMKKIVFFLSTGYAGMDAVEFCEYDDDVTDQQLDNDAWMFAIQHAESYGIYPECYREGAGELGEEFDDSYSDNIEGSWEIYDSGKHDGYAVGGDVPFKD
jgi:hypothetical protein